MYKKVEIEQMLDNEALTLNDVQPSSYTNPWQNITENNKTDEMLFAHEGTGSGGYADHIFKYAVKELFGENYGKLEYKDLR